MGEVNCLRGTVGYNVCSFVKFYFFFSLIFTKFVCLTPPPPIIELSRSERSELYVKEEIETFTKHSPL